MRSVRVRGVKVSVLALVRETPADPLNRTSIHLLHAFFCCQLGCSNVCAQMCAQMCAPKCAPKLRPNVRPNCAQIARPNFYVKNITVCAIWVHQMGGPKFGAARFLITVGATIGGTFFLTNNVAIWVAIW